MAEANFENRTYYFTLQSKSENEVRIEMYSTPYTLIKTKEGWTNAGGNKFNMNVGLIKEVIKVVLPGQQ